MNAKITDLARWRATHRLPVIETCRWSDAIESAARSNIEALFLVTFLWPRVLLRVTFGV